MGEDEIDLLLLLLELILRRCSGSTSPLWFRSNVWATVVRLFSLLELCQLFSLSFDSLVARGDEFDFAFALPILDLIPAASDEDLGRRSIVQ